MSVKADIHELEQLKKRLENLKRNSNTFFEQAALNVGMRALRKIKQRTPRRTGTLRNAWQITDTLRHGESVTVLITNDTDYASHVEYGHRVVRYGQTVGYVKGRYMMTISMREIEKEKNILLQRELDKFIRRSLS